MNHYKIVSCETIEELETEINGLIENGWECQGGPFMTDTEVFDEKGKYRIGYCIGQAVIKLKKVSTQCKTKKL